MAAYYFLLYVLEKEKDFEESIRNNWRLYTKIICFSQRWCWQAHDATNNWHETRDGAIYSNQFKSKSNKVFLTHKVSIWSS